MATPGSKPIDELVRRAIIGDGTAFTELWDTHIDALKAYLRSSMKQLDSFFVDDVCSRSFEKAFRQIGSYDPSRSQFLTWLKTIAHNTALDTIEAEGRARRGYVYIDDDAPEGGKVLNSIKDDVDTPLESIIRTEDEEQTLSCIEGLPELYRDVARKRLVDGMKYADIAEQTGLELNTVRTRIRRAKALIDKMKNDSSEI